MELPPRARRIQTIPWVATTLAGTTSACAENTRRHRPCPRNPWNYLRVRGEYERTNRSVPRSMELPPRARRIQMKLRCLVVSIGTTSACAENTLVAVRQQVIEWNYLRVRGEYPGAPPAWSHASELPPRARRIHAVAWDIGIHCGTTSACAENTQWSDLPGFQGRNYLRVRGEYTA